MSSFEGEHTYHEILEIEPGASKEQIKSAYRSLAKKYHPDASKGSTEEKFIQLTEAYEALMSGRQAKDPQINYSWDQFYNEEELRRQRAREYAQMKYEEFVTNNTAFKKSWYYNPVKNLLYGVIVLGYSMFALFLLGPLIGYLLFDITGLKIGIALFMVTPLVYRTTADLRKEIKPYFMKYDA